MTLELKNIDSWIVESLGEVRTVELIQTYTQAGCEAGLVDAELRQFVLNMLDANAGLILEKEWLTEHFG